jgi:hypothetical protein
MKIERVEIEINGKKLMVMPHMIPTYAKLGGRQTKRVVKETPRELLFPTDRLKTLLQIPKEPLPEMKITKIEPAKTPNPVTSEVKPVETLEKAPSRRKPSVKSKSTK